MNVIFQKHADQIRNANIAIIIIMLRHLYRSIIYTAHSLKNYTYSRPEEIDWLKHKFYSNPKYADKLDYLSKLEKENSLRNFFENKNIDLLNEEEIYYLFNSEMDYKIDERGKEELMAKIKSTFFKCVLAKEFQWSNEIEQCLIVINFNQEIFEMTPAQISFCLEIISEFEIARSQIDKTRLESKLRKYVAKDEHTYHLILITGYLLDMDIEFPEFVNVQTFERWLEKNDNFDFRAIYFLHKLSEKLKYTLSEGQKSMLNDHMKVAIPKLEINYFESDYLVFLLEYYPQCAKVLNILHFTPRAYQSYLLFYKQHPEIKLSEHKIPHSVIELTSVYTFRTIIEYRMNLGLDNALSLAKSLPDFFSHSLKAVNSYLSYLKDNKIDDLEIEFYLEKALEKAFKLNQQFTLDITQTFSVNEMLTLFAHLSRNRLCSVDFWKKAVKMLEKMIEINKLIKIIQFRNQNYVNLLAISASKNFKEQTREAIYKELIDLLSNPKNDLTMKLLIKITRILAANKIGEDEIWLYIERRVLKYIHTQKQPREMMGDGLKESLGRLILSFNSLEKGSYKFWTEMNETLDLKTKKDILNKIKQPKSLAHMHLITNYS